MSKFFTKTQLKIEVENGMKESEIAAKYKCCEGSVAYHKQKWRLLTNELCPTNPTNRNRKITNCYICGNPITLRMKCRTCTKIIRRQAIKQALINFKGGACEICGYNQCPSSLDFHHLKEKNFGIGNALHGNKLKDVVKEVLTCKLLCSNCHRQLHYNLSKASKEEYQKLIKDYTIKNSIEQQIIDISAA